MTHLMKDHTMSKAIGNDGGMYQLARKESFNVQPFGPAMSLAKAQAYQADMALANVHVLVVRLNAQ